MVFNYRHHIVRDLAWAIASPPLLILEGLPCAWFDNQWYQGLYESSLDWLQGLDEDPGVLQEILDSQKDRRLGRYFETLWAFWLEQSPRFEVIEHNLPLRHDGNTLGELDFLLLDKHTGKYLHWEVAVKFYLGTADTSNHANWHGPGKKDRMDLKVRHLCNRQSVISWNPKGQRLIKELGYRVDDCGIILKGRLFYPYASRDTELIPIKANIQHLRSYWISLSDLQQLPEIQQKKQVFYPLLGYGWMASAEKPSKSPPLSIEELEKALRKGPYRLPLFVCCEQEDGSRQRIFVVSDDWDDDFV